jgi:hypothetical protein
LSKIPLNLINEGIKIIEFAALSVKGMVKDRLEPIMTYFKNNWINGPLTKRPNVWNYYEFIGRQTNNDVEGFNRICNRVLRAKNPNIYKFIDALKRFDQEMSLQVEYFKKNPLNPYGYPKSAKQKQKEEAFTNLKSAFAKEEISLKLYMFSVASQIEPTEYLNEPICGEVLGGLGQGVDIISKVADDFIFALNDSGSREIMNSEIIREDFNFDAANLGGLIGLRHNEDNPVISTNNGYFLPSKSHPNNRLQNSDELEQGDFNNSLDKDGHSTLLSIPLIPKVVAAVFPAIIPQDNSLLYNICYECSETLGNKGMTCVQCKESFHVKCHVLPKYVTITNYYLKAGLKNWKCSRCKPPKSK